MLLGLSLSDSKISIGPTYTLVRPTGVPLYLVHTKQISLSPWGGGARQYAHADGSSTRGGSTSFGGRVRSPHMAKLQAARVPIA